jgi:hypothetical protein
MDGKTASNSVGGSGSAFRSGIGAWLRASGDELFDSQYTGLSVRRRRNERLQVGIQYFGNTAIVFDIDNTGLGCILYV